MCSTGEVYAMESGSASAAPLEGRSEEGTLYETRSWPEIEAFLFGSAPSQPSPIEVCNLPSCRLTPDLNHAVFLYKPG